MKNLNFNLVSFVLSILLGSSFLSCTFNHLAAQPIQFCGVLEQPPFKPGQNEVVFDRFGNTYNVDDILRIQAKGQLGICNPTDLFQLNFIGNFDADDEQTICKVFQDLSGLISTNSTVHVPINIMQGGPLPNGALAAASGFYLEECGLVSSMVLQVIRTGQNNLPGGIAAGVINIRPQPTPSTTWFSLQDELSAPINSSQYDLYSVVMHEALHILGIASFIGLDGNSNGLDGDTYSYWDKFLTGGVNGAHLIVPDPQGKCCDAFIFNTTDFPNMPTPLSGGCNINVHFTEGVNNIAPVNNANSVPIDDDEMSNKLSHLDISCGASNYVMHPEIDVAVVRRIVTSEELTILCNLGYNASGCGSNCALAANDDYPPQTIILTGPGAQTFLNISYASLLANDVIPPGSVTLNLVPNCGSGAGIHVINLPNPSIFKVIGLTEGTWTFCYSVVGCTGTVCDQAIVTIIVLNSKIETDCSTSDCNLVCFGDFEDFSQMVSGYDVQLQNPNYQVIPPNNTVPSTADIPKDQNGNKLVSFLSIINGATFLETESMLIPLAKPIADGCTIEINASGATRLTNSNHPVPPLSPTLGIYGFTGNACMGMPFSQFDCQQQPINLCSESVFCIEPSEPITVDPNIPWSNNYSIVTNLDLAPLQTVTWTNNTGEEITHLFIMGNMPGNPDPTSEYTFLTYFLDNISVTSSCTPKVSIQSLVKEQCINGKATIEYELCLDNLQSNQTVPIHLQVHIPQGVGINIESGGGFDNNGAADITLPDLDGDPNCSTLTLTLSTGSNIVPGTEITIGLEPTSPNACFENEDVILNLETCAPDPKACSCIEGVNIFNIGTNQQSVTYASQTPLMPLVIGGLANACISINGQLIWDIIGGSIETSHIIMNEGAEVVVKGNHKLYLYDNLIEGCSLMWKGFTVKPLGGLRLEGNRVYDAQYAVYAEDKSYFRALNNTFDHNDIGIYVPWSSNGQMQTIFEDNISGNKFKCTEPLSPPFNGQTPAPGQYSHAGILLNDVGGFNIGWNNRFEGISNGVLAYRSTFTIDKCRFLNLIANNNGNLDLYGVYADHCASARITRCVMTDVANGIIGFMSNIEATGNNIATFTNKITGQYNSGITCLGNSSLQAKIENDTIKASRNAITIADFTNSFVLGVHIKNNIVDLFSNPSEWWREAMFFNNCNNGWISGNIVNNESVGNQFIGMNFLNTKNYNILFNHINDQRRGVWVSGCMNNYFLGNEVINDAIPSAEGFAIFNSVDRYCNNKTDGQTGEGFYFQGACTPTNFGCNEIGDASNGLNLWADNSDPSLLLSTLIGEQLNKGNSWSGSYGGFGAFNGSVVFDDIIESRFSTFISQTPSWSTGLGQSVAWFQPGIPVNCSSTCPIPIEQIIRYPTNLEGQGYYPTLGSNDPRIARGEVKGAGISWMAQQGLYMRLRNNSSLVSTNNDVRAFYQNASQGSIGQLFDLQKGMATLGFKSEFTQYYVVGIYDDIATTSIDLQTLIATGPEVGKEDAWHSRIYALQSDVTFLTELYFELLTWINTQDNVLLPGLAAHNAAISTTNVCANNEKTLNALYLEHQLWDYSVKPTAVINALKAIADQCPLAGGLAVYSARSIYKNYDVNAWWDDLNACNTSQERNKITASGSQLELMVMPNPTNDLLRLLFSSDLQQDLLFEVIDINGKRVLYAPIQKGQNAFQFSISELPEGVYFYRIQGSISRLYSGKIILSH